MSTETQPLLLSNIGNVIAVASGKGGVGKSTVSVNLAIALAKGGHKVGLLDADIYGPSQHIMLGLKNATPAIGEDRKIIPLTNHGLKIMSFGFFVKPEEAVVWRGPMIARMLQQFVNDVNWGELDYLVVDLPPGTGDVQLSLSQILSVTGAVIVTTPQDIALADAVKGVSMFQKVNVEIIGIVENMGYFECPKCHHETPIFDRDGGKKKAKELNVPFLGSLPLEAETRRAGDEGTPIVALAPKSPQAERFMQITALIEAEVEKIRLKGPAISPVPHPPSGVSGTHFEV
ncbi:MAG: Mrp/NBP35 family ATP-binding protein [Deltaproteobacteria bacterium]|nr:Mrp/NBP35 family ATP-binding protein [Deltaproteobacteria bacterium]